MVLYIKSHAQGLTIYEFLLYNNNIAIAVVVIVLVLVKKLKNFIIVLR